MNKSILAISIFLMVILAVPVFAASGEFDALIRKKGPSASEVVTKPTLFRAVELPGLPVTKGQFEFLLDHPTRHGGPRAWLGNYRR